MNFQEVIGNFVNVVSKKYFCFDGRTGRKAFWQFVLVSFVINFVLNLIPGIGIYLSGVWTLAILCPTLGIVARRLHDTGKSGWMQLLCLVPVVGGLIVLLLCIPAGNAAPNQYGELSED
jgi:uncharacterized membrane protein YhaH (DUF805 family)